jgi:hypothetical protein
MGFPSITEGLRLGNIFGVKRERVLSTWEDFGKYNPSQKEDTPHLLSLRETVWFFSKSWRVVFTLIAGSPWKISV